MGAFISLPHTTAAGESVCRVLEIADTNLMKLIRSIWGWMHCDGACFGHQTFVYNTHILIRKKLWEIRNYFPLPTFQRFSVLTNRAIIHFTSLQWLFWLCEVRAIVDCWYFRNLQTCSQLKSYPRQQSTNVAYTEVPSTSKKQSSSFASQQPLSLLSQQPLLFSSGRTWASSGGVS